MSELDAVKNKLKDLKIVRNELEELKKVDTLTVSSDPLENYKKQYDAIMKFYFLSEDIEKLLGTMDVNFENEFEVRRLKKELTKCWTDLKQ